MNGREAYSLNDALTITAPFVDAPIAAYDSLDPFLRLERHSYLVIPDCMQSRAWVKSKNCAAYNADE